MLKRKCVIDNSLAPQEWIASLSWRISQIENDLCMQNIWIYFLYHNSILLLFLRHSPIECTPRVHVTLLRIEVQKCLLSPSRSFKSCVIRSPSWKRATGNQRKQLMCTFVFCPTDITVSKIFPRLYFHFPSQIFFVSFFLSCFLSLKLHGPSCDIILYHHLIIFKLCSTVDCVFFGWSRWRCLLFNVRTVCTMFVVWVYRLEVSKRNSCWVEKKKNKVL